jgi:hypothetical protein
VARRLLQTSILNASKLPAGTLTDSRPSTFASEYHCVQKLPTSGVGNPRSVPLAARST